MLKKAVDYFIAVIALTLFTAFIYDLVCELPSSVDHNAVSKEQFSEN